MGTEKGRHKALIFSAFLVSVIIGFALLCFGSEVPPISSGDFEGTVASEIWMILAGQGTWGALLFAFIGLVWKFAKPYLDQWATAKRLDLLYGFAQTAVINVRQTYTDAIKASSADGKLTNEEKDEALARAKAVLIGLAKSQGIDIVKEYGLDFLDWIIEKFVGNGKDADLLKAVAGPLSGLTQKTAQAIPQPPLPDLQP